MLVSRPSLFCSEKARNLLIAAVHRLVASLAFVVRLSPVYELQVGPLMEVLQVKDVLKGKLVKGSGWNVDGGLAKKDVRRLVQEVADKLCP